jgi:hypothetical protein
LNKTLAKSLAATLGRISLVLHEDVAKISSKIMKQWLLSLRMLG